MLSERGMFVAEKRLLRKDATGKVIETPDEMFMRVAQTLGKSKKEVEEFYNVMSNLYFLPNSPCLVNAGIKGRQQNLSACFVLGIEDSLEGIYDTLKQTALIHKHGGGTGFNFNNLRPRDSIVNSTHGVSSGPVSFMKVFDASTAGIKQGGVRRGANIGILRIDHPDIEEFITCKDTPGELTNFNISVAITDAFMEAVFHDGYVQLQHPSGKGKKVKAKYLWDMIVKSAHAKGDPGVLFIDRINLHNPLKGKENIIEATNPCGEVPLSVNEVCCLGSINLSAMITETGNINYPLLHATSTTAVKLLNRLIDASDYPNEIIKQKVMASRKIGVGVMGTADAFIKLKLPYSSSEALEYMEDFMQNILDSCVAATHDLGKRDGTFEAFSNYNPPKHIREALKRLNILYKDYKPRNATLTTIAPTGTLSMIADCSSGIEPVFYFKQVENRVDEERTYVHPLYAEFRKQYPKVHLPTYFQEAHDIPIDAHVQMQATCQQYTCNAVSKTINLPQGSSSADVDKVYREAYMLGCKGVTVYVDGSLDGQTLSGIDGGQKSAKIGHIEPLKRPEMLSGSTFTINTGFGPLFVTVNNYDEKPFEVLCNIGKSGASENAKAEACGRLISLALRCGISLQHIIEQISGIVGGTAQHTEYGLVTSIPDGIAKVLTNKILNTPTLGKTVGMRKCPDCQGSDLHYEGSCLVCNTCGWKSCGQ